MLQFKSKARPLPENRSTAEDPEFGYLEPVRIPEGKCSMRQALEFITNHQADKIQFSAANIADQYKLEKGNVQKVLKYFHMLDVQIPMLPDGKTSSQEAHAMPRLSSKPATMLKEDSKPNETNPSDPQKSSS